ncbi:MAG: type II CRISPR-associated endonuclease Cas1 [Candidatus Bruticola sp.]
MEFKSIFVANSAQISVRLNQLVICQQDEEVLRPLEDMTSLMVESRQVTITAAALQKLAEYEVTVYFCDERHLPSALLLPLNYHCRQLKVLQAQIDLKKVRQKHFWQQIVIAKIKNQAACLNFAQKPGADYLRALATKVRSGDSQNCEATAAAFYFPRLFGPGFARELPCLANSLLNYAYSIIRGAVARNLVTHGLEPCLGVFHHNQLNQFNLADDLMEPLRPLADLFAFSYLQQNLCSQQSDELTPSVKRELFNLTNYVMQQQGKRVRLIGAIISMVESFSRALTEGSDNLDLPQLIPLESYQYE